MPSTITHSVSHADIAPEVLTAIESISLPEVQDMIRQLSKYNLAVCVPHMHSLEQDFAVLPQGIVQAERQCEVSWISREQMEACSGMVPVGWRWEDDGVSASATCWASCEPTATGHIKPHRKVD